MYRNGRSTCLRQSFAAWVSLNEVDAGNMSSNGCFLLQHVYLTFYLSAICSSGSIPMNHHLATEVVAVFKPKFGFKDLPFVAVSVMEYLHCIHFKYATKSQIVSEYSSCIKSVDIQQHIFEHQQLFAWGSK